MNNRQILVYACTFLVLLLISCNNGSKVENKSAKKANTERKTPAPSLENKTSVALNVQNEADFIGLWSGRFDTTQDCKELQTLWNNYRDSLYEAGKEDGEDYPFEDPDISTDQFYNGLDSKYKKFIDTDAKFGVGYIIRPNKISIIISSISDSVILGKSICAGNERPLKGKFLSKSATDWEIMLDEPGTDKYDGRIVLKINKNELGATGTYTPFDTLQKAKQFQFKRKNFIYDIDATWVYSGSNVYVEDFNPSKRVFKVSDVENQPKSVLRIARNSIYARHGYSFKSKDVRNYFERFDDYIPTSTDVRKELSDVEIKNEKLLKRYEEYANEFYDSYGR
ncbi:MAG: YARHG domain-containing protein [Cytophagales bacterium]